MRHLWDADDIGYLESYYGEVVTTASGSAAIRNFSFRAGLLAG